mmetsp:Transcript_13355/g.26309  ORF Transcript_13355/g.26309 Transcript_13355/m.26309 type:complete len:387 (+) Transcript_13355:49-1209(+)
MGLCSSLVSTLVGTLLVVMTLKAYEGGEFKTLRTHGMEGCRRLGVEEGVIGAEDIHFRGDGVAFMSSDDRHYWETNMFGNFSTRVPNAKSNGGIFSYDPSTNKLQKLHHTGASFPRDFHPHGISIIPRVGFQPGSDSASTTLYAVNHRRDGDAVEVFEVDGSELRHVKSVRSSLWKNINDVAATEGGFYVTNYMERVPFTHPLAVPELINFGVEIGAGGYVLFCRTDAAEGQEACVRVLEQLRMPNGVELSSDGKRAFVIESLGQRVGLYDVPPEGHGGRLLPVKTLYVGTLCDNIAISPTGRMYSGCHPKAMTFKFLHAKAPQRYRSPSSILSFDPSLDSFRTELMSADGTPLSGSSSAAFHGSTLLMGGVNDLGFVACSGRSEA